MYNCPVEKSVTAPFARARVCIFSGILFRNFIFIFQHVPIYSPQYHKYEDRPKIPLRSFDMQQGPINPPMAQIPSQSLVVSSSSGRVNYNSNKPSSRKLYAFYGEEELILECEDRITVCWWTADRCRSPAIYQVMSSLCPKTCKFC